MLQEPTCKLPEKLCSSALRAKAALNAKGGHTTCWFNLVNRSYLIKKIYLWHFFWKGSSFYSIFTQVPKTFNSTLVLQGCFLKHLGDVATDLLDLVCLSFFMSFQTDWMMIRSDLCVEHWLLSDIHWIITINGKMNVWTCKLIFPTDTLQQKLEITGLKPF